MNAIKHISVYYITSILHNHNWARVINVSKYLCKSVNLKIFSNKVMQNVIYYQKTLTYKKVKRNFVNNNFNDINVSIAHIF